MIAQSILREFRVNTGAVNDVVAWFCAAAAFFAMAHAFKHGDFVRVTLLLDSVNAKTRRVLELVSLFIGSVSVAYLAWSGPASSPMKAGSSTTSRRACCPCRCGFRS
jgi:TRAP-type C4-dicarboxylate transport system permease small subunit